MRAIILAAGLGNRMRPLTDGAHKTLLTVGGQTILGRIVDGLAQSGVTRILVVTGYRADDVRGWLDARYGGGGLEFEFVHNARYRETNNIVSMSLAFEQGGDDDDVILVESDLVCEPAVFARVVRSPHADAALVDRYRTGMDGTVVTVAGGIVTSVVPPHLQTGDFSFDDKYKTLNIYKLSRAFCRSFRQVLAFYARAIDDRCYYELVLGVLIYVQAARIHAEVLGGERWAEIDDPNDLRVAEFEFSPGERRRILEETAGGYWAYEGLLDFSFLRNMHFPTPAILAELRANLPRLVQNYGSRQDVLERKLSYFLLCKPERVVALNGASQIYPLLAAQLAGTRVLLPSPTFGEYARAFPGHPSYPDRFGVDLGRVEAQAGGAGAVVFVNPNNPTGTALPTDWIHDFAARRRDLLVIVDESFLAFGDQPSIVARLEEAPLENVLVIASLSKTLGVPGARLGYAYTCDAERAGALRRSLPIWNMGSIAEHLLEIALKHRASLAESYRATAGDRAAFAAELARVRAVETVHPSGGNFLLVTLREGSPGGAQIVDRLLERHAIFVKDASPKLADGRVHLRLAVRTPPENLRLCAALDDAAAAGRA